MGTVGGWIRVPVLSVVASPNLRSLLCRLLSSRFFLHFFIHILTTVTLKQPQQLIHTSKMMSASAVDVKGLSKSLVNEYKKSATTQTQIVDLFLVFILVTGVLQFLYCVLVGSFPFNSFLSGFLSCVGMFALTGTFSFMCVCLLCDCRSWNGTGRG